MSIRKSVKLLNLTTEQKHMHQHAKEYTISAPCLVQFNSIGRYVSVTCMLLCVTLPLFFVFLGNGTVIKSIDKVCNLIITVLLLLLPY